MHTESHINAEKRIAELEAERDGLAELLRSVTYDDIASKPHDLVEATAIAKARRAVCEAANNLGERLRSTKMGVDGEFQVETGQLFAAMAKLLELEGK